MKNFFLRLLLLFTVSSILIGCEGAVGPAGGVATITVTPSQTTVEVNKTVQFTAQATIPTISFRYGASAPRTVERSFGSFRLNHGLSSSSRIPV